jgi:S1-C subfamily serine protease
MIMKSYGIKPVLAAVSCLGMLFLSTATAETPLASPGDVALGNGGVLVGQVVDAQGKAAAMATVILADHQQEIARVRTDQEGKFSALGLRGGVYRISSQGQETIYRLWAPNTAPPIAQQGVTLVVGNDVVRGQSGISLGPFASMAQLVADHPLITASAIGAVIAIPIALDDDDWTPPADP